MPPCIDVYSLSPRRDRATIQRFLARYASSHQTIETIVVLPSGYEGPVRDLPLNKWEEISVHSLDDLLTFLLVQPPLAFTAYLRSQRPWCGVILCCARTGEITFGVSVDDPLNSEDALQTATALLGDLCEETGASRGWAVHEMPPSVDPQVERPWDDALSVADFAR